MQSIIYNNRCSINTDIKEQEITSCIKNIGDNYLKLVHASSPVLIGYHLGHIYDNIMSLGYPDIAIDILQDKKNFKSKIRELILELKQKLILNKI